MLLEPLFSLPKTKCMPEETLHCIHFRSGQGFVYHDRQALAYDRQAQACDKQAQVCDKQVTVRNNELVGVSHGENRDVSHDKNTDVSRGENSDMSHGANHDGCKRHSIYRRYASRGDHKEYSSLGCCCGSCCGHSGHSSHSDRLNQKMSARYDKI